MKLHTYVVIFQAPYLDDKITNNLRQASKGCWCHARLFGTCHLFYTPMDINEMRDFLKETVGGRSYIFHETNGEIYRYTLTTDDQLKALQDFINDKAKIDNKIFKLEQKQKEEQAAKEDAKELDEQFEKSELSELIT